MPLNVYENVNLDLVFSGITLGVSPGLKDTATDIGECLLNGL
jgi:hypothetical protein